MPRLDQLLRVFLCVVALIIGFKFAQETAKIRMEQRALAAYEQAYASRARQHASAFSSPAATATSSYVATHSGIPSSTSLGSAYPSHFLRNFLWVLSFRAIPLAAIIYLVVQTDWRNVFENVPWFAEEVARFLIRTAISLVVWTLLLPFRAVAAIARFVYATYQSPAVRTWLDALRQDASHVYLRVRYSSIANFAHLRYEYFCNWIGRNKLRLFFFALLIWLFSGTIERSVIGPAEIYVPWEEANTVSNLKIPEAFWQHQAIHQGRIRGAVDVVEPVLKIVDVDETRTFRTASSYLAQDSETIAIGTDAVCCSAAEDDIITQSEVASSLAAAVTTSSSRFVDGSSYCMRCRQKHCCELLESQAQDLG